MHARITIEDVAPGGEGVGRLEGRAVFVPFTAPGDQVLADVPAGDGVAHATLLAVEVPGPVRVPPPCRHFGPMGEAAAPPPLALSRRRQALPADGARPKAEQFSKSEADAVGPEAPDGAERGCGGCEWLHLAYAAQLEAKARTVAGALQRIARLAPGSYELRPIVASPSPLRYRTRAKFHHDRDAGRLVFFRRRSHAPVPLRECHLLVPGLDALREAVGPALAAARLSVREVSLEWSEVEGRGAALLQVAEVSPAVRARAEALLGAVPSLAGAVLQAEGGPVTVVGDPVLRQLRVPADAAAGLQRSRPDVFQQANRGANALLVRTALSLLAPAGEDVLELHCGAGNFTGPLAAVARSVAAVEVQGPALELARADQAEAAARGGPGSVRFFAGDAIALARAFARERGPDARRFGVALLDPPREGAKGIGPALRELRVSRAVYVSCDPATLARDVRGCVEAGFRVGAVVPVDMFPQTHHVEGVVLLER